MNHFVIPAEPLTIAVPATTLRELLDLAQQGQNPVVPFDPDHGEMQLASYDYRGEKLDAIAAKLKEVL
jgi:hypothetical protein